MHSHSITILKLGRPGPRNRGLYVTKAGVFLGPGCALARILQDSNGRKSASIRSEADLAKLLTAAYGRRVETRLLRRELATLANALIEGNLFKATLRATYLAMPELPDEDATRRLLEAEEFLKTGFNPDEPRDEHHQRWVSAGGDDATTPRQLAQANTDEATPAQESQQRQSPLSAQERQRTINRTMRNEGGFSNNPYDRGGRTFFGKTQTGIDEYNRLRSADDPALTLNDLNPTAIRRANPMLTAEQATEIARDRASQIYDRYMQSYRIDEIEDPAIRDQVFDMAVNLGFPRAVAMFRDVTETQGFAVNTPTESQGRPRRVSNEELMGQLAAYTNATYRRSDDLYSEPVVRRINNDLVDSRVRYYERIAQNNPTQARFLNGWRNRANSFRW